MSIGVQNVLDIAPEFSTEDPSRITIFINNAALFINRKTWGTKSDIAHAYLTAHFLKSSPSASGGGGAVGPITSEKVGPLERTYAAASVSNTDYSSTAYGRIFDQLKRTILTSPFIVGA